MTDPKDKVYKDAWELLKEKLQRKTTWGKNEMLDLMKDCLIESAMRYL